MPKPCHASNDEAHRVHTATTRLLCCGRCGATFSWSETGDRLPYHDEATAEERAGSECHYHHGQLEAPAVAELLEAREPAELVCICPPETLERECYKPGCPACIARNLEAGPSVSYVRAEPVTVTYYEGRWTVGTPVLHDDGQGAVVASSQVYQSCGHRHETPEAADRCAHTHATRIRKAGR